MQIDIVTPLAPWDLDRYEILLRSIAKFWRVEGRVKVIVPASDYLSMKTKIRGFELPVEVIPDTVVTPECPTSWHKQMLIKLAAHTVVESKAYLTIDADMFLVKPIELVDVVQAGRLIFAYEKTPIPEQIGWYHACQKILHVDDKDMPPYRVFPSACFLWRDVVESIGSFLWYHSDREHSVPQEGHSWQAALLKKPGWLELGLYHVHCGRYGDFDRRHFVKERIVGNSVWYKQQAENWQPGPSFEDPDFLFTVIQSNTQIPAQWTSDHVRSYLL